jgi:hypothetical protein
MEMRFMEHRFSYPSVTELPRRPIDAGLAAQPALGSSTLSAARVPHHGAAQGACRNEPPRADAAVARASAGSAVAVLA